MSVCPAPGLLAAAFSLLLVSPAAARAAGAEDFHQPGLVREQDDARQRLDARRAGEAESPVSAGERARQLLEARKERDRVGPSAPAVRVGARPGSGALRVQGTTWLNAGPTRSDFSVNDVVYHDVDSGRARTLIAHPSDPGILYLATSGGGVWKTWDGGLGWTPLTDRIGSTSVGQLAMDPSNPDILYLGLGDPFDVPQPGLVWSTDGGETWSEPVFLSGTYKDASAAAQPVTASTVRDLAVDPTNSAQVMVATDVGLFQSSDQARTFAQVNLPGVHSYAEAWSIAWVGGKSWLVTGRDFNPALVDAAGNLLEGPLLLWRTDDAGATWQDAVTALPSSNQSLGRATLAVAAVGRGTPQARVFLLAGSSDGRRTADLFRSDDAGAHFLALGVNGLRQPKNPTSSVGTLDVLGLQAFYNQALLVDPENPDVVFVGGQFGMIRSRDGGLAWEVLTDWLPAGTALKQPYVHADFHSLTASLAGGRKRFFLGTDGGVFQSLDLHSSAVGQTHVSDALNHGLVTHLAYSVACAPSAWPAPLQGFLLGGLQDNGTRLRALSSVNGPGTFDQIFGGDGFGVATSAGLDPSGRFPELLLATTYNGHLWGSFDGGQTFDKFGITIPGAPFRTKVIRDEGAAFGLTFLTTGDPTDSSSATVYRSVAGGQWSSINGTIHRTDGAVIPTFASPAVAAAIPLYNVASHPTQAGVYALAGGSGVVFVTPDGGANWYQSALLGTGAGNPNLWIGRILGVAFDPRDGTGNTLWAGASGSTIFDLTKPTGAGTPVTAGFGHLFFSADRGRTWQPRSGGAGHQLPNLPVQAVRVDPGDGDTLYVGTNIGLYRSVDAGQTFDRFGDGLPLVEVTDLCLAPGSGSLKIATYGRGFWEIDTGPGGLPAGARGRGDLDFNHRLDAFDLLDLVSAMGTNAGTDGYRPEADMVGALNQIDDDDLAAFLQRAGGAP